ncbi:hypothetical protein HKBW3S43_02017, partial [Candidatus Hakubella thermalkaliphila]
IKGIFQEVGPYPAKVYSNGHQNEAVAHLPKPPHPHFGVMGPLFELADGPLDGRA